MFHQEPNGWFSCGIGTHSINLAKKGYQVVGCDPSTLYIEKAKHTANAELGDKGTHMRFYQAEACKATKVLLEYTTSR
jgi:2-polyprenyl-3-methyl-5-hydroxy-6-metoxy-1,4-benzoquinol methylase